MPSRVRIYVLILTHFPHSSEPIEEPGGTCYIGDAGVPHDAPPSSRNDVKDGQELLMSGQVVRETTILYGVLIRIGGYTRPRAYMQFLDGQKLSVSIANRSLAIAMAARLYESIGVRGIAAYSARDRQLVGFHVQELLPTREAPQDALKGLAQIVGKMVDSGDD
jgi:hypothetical protein